MLNESSHRADQVSHALIDGCASTCSTLRMKCYRLAPPFQDHHILPHTLYGLEVEYIGVQKLHALQAPCRDG